MQEGRPEMPPSPEQQVTSKYGIRYDNVFDIGLLNIPIDVVAKIGGKDVVTRKIHPDIFDGSYAMGSGENGNFFTVEFPKDTPAEKIQELIDAVERLYDQA